jgi:hypothetical protein
MWQTIFLSLERGKESKPALDSFMIFVEEQFILFNYYKRETPLSLPSNRRKRMVERCST